MSNTKDTGGPAFPGPYANANRDFEILFEQQGMTLNANGDFGILFTQQGMTLRDYFAAQGLKGMLSDPNICGAPMEFAVRAYALADAMVQARKQ